MPIKKSYTRYKRNKTIRRKSKKIKRNYKHKGGSKINSNNNNVPANIVGANNTVGANYNCKEKFKTFLKNNHGLKIRELNDILEKSKETNTTYQIKTKYSDPVFYIDECQEQIKKIIYKIKEDYDKIFNKLYATYRNQIRNQKEIQMSESDFIKIFKDAGIEKYHTYFEYYKSLFENPYKIKLT